MKDYMFRMVCIITFFLMTSQLCTSQELSVEQLIAGVNQSRSIIESGEMSVIVRLRLPSEKSPEELQTWLEKKKEEILRSDHAVEEKRELLKKVFIRDKWLFSEHEEVEESEVAFQILHYGPTGGDIDYKFKMNQVDCRGIKLYTDEARLLNGGYYRIITYDSEAEAYEEIDPCSGIAFANSNSWMGFRHFELFGRSLNQVPPNAKLLGREKVGNTDCYVLEFGELRRVIWIDPKTFCIRREERYDKTFKWELVYEDFQKYGEIWFPRVSRWTGTRGKRKEELYRRWIVVVKEAQFNIDFPPNFFKVDPTYYLNQNLEILPKSENVMGLKTKYQPMTQLQDIDPDLLKCGPNSLLHVCEILNVDTNFDELCKLSNYNRNAGTTMLGLLQAARYKNLNPKGIKANIKALKLNKVLMPAIAYVKGNHFLVFERIVSDGVLIYDPANKYEHHLSYRKLSNSWNGEALVFNYKLNSVKSSSAPRVFVESGFYNFGEAPGGSKIKHTFKLKNTGNSVLKIFEVRRTCKCTATIVSQDEIPPGKYGAIEAVLRVPSDNRGVEESIYVYTNSPTQNKIALTFKGTAFMPITTFPTLVSFDQIAPKSTLKKTLTVHRAKGKDVQVTGVRVDSKNLKARIVSEKGNSITRIEIVMLESMPIGPFYNKLFIDYFFKGQKATHVVRIKGEVLGEFRVSPRNLFFGLVDGKKAVTKTITISHIKAQAFEITNIQTDSKYLTFKITPMEGNTEYYIKISINPGVPEGEFSDKICIRTDSAIQPKINLSLYCIVSK